MSIWEKFKELWDDLIGWFIQGAFMGAGGFVGIVLVFKVLGGGD